MSTLSIFIDESGDIGEYQAHSPYYIMTLVFHDQKDSIDNHLKHLNNELANLGYGDMAVHTEPLIRREEAYCNLRPNERRSILTKLYFLALRAPIQYKTIIVEKKECRDVFDIEAKLARELAAFIRSNLTTFQSFDNIILYYDNGQRIINRIINTVFATELSDYTVRKVMPKDYRLFQVADLICTIELTKQKLAHGGLSKSEQYIFHSKKAFYKDFVRRLEKKQL